MALTLSAHQTRRLRLKSQRLLPSAGLPGTATESVREVVGVQAQELPAARLSIRARSVGLTDAGIAIEQQGGLLVWTWAMRGTLHLLAAEDARWLIPLFGPRLIAAGQRRLQQLGWDDDRLAAGLRLLRQALEQREQVTRPELACLLKSGGLPSQGQAPVHLAYRAALEGSLVIEISQDGPPAYVLWERRIGKIEPLPRPESLERIARRYLMACGPAGPQDLAAWAGLIPGEARTAFGSIAEETIAVETGGGPAWMLKESLAGLEGNGRTVSVRLLPRYDTYLLSYAKRELAVDPAYARRIHPGGGIIHPVVLVDGQARGVWKAENHPMRVDIRVEPFENLDNEILTQIEGEVADIGRFLSKQTQLIRSS